MMLFWPRLRIICTGLPLYALCAIPLAGCVSAGGTHASVSSLAAPLAGDDHLVNLASQSGAMWPLTVAGLVALLAAIVAWFAASRASAIGLLIIGIVICVLPVFLLDVLTHLSIPLAIILGIAGVASLAYYLGALWQRWRFRKRLSARADYVEGGATSANLTTSSVGKILRAMDRPDFNPEKDIR